MPLTVILMEGIMTKVKMQNSVTEGNIFFGLLRFAVPLVLSGMLQIFYNMADSIVVGKFSGDYYALGSIGSTSSLTGLIINVMIALSVGATVLVSQLYGAKKSEDVSRTVHTAMAIALIGGIIMMTLGIAVSRPALSLMGTKDVYFEKALIYARIICIGAPAVAVYNFGSGILRAIGDSKTSLFILSASGLLNVGLNLFLVIVCHLSVEGVAIATIAAQYTSAIAVVIVLNSRRGESYRFQPRKIRVEKQCLTRIFRIGIPAMLQTVFFALSSVIIVSAMNTFPAHLVQANSIATSIEAFTYTAMNSIAGAALTFMGQNFGAKQYSRMNKVFVFSAIQVIFIALFISHTEVLFGRALAMLYIDSTNPDLNLIVDSVMEILSIMLMLYFLCGVFEVNSAVLRAMGYSVRSMIASIISVTVRVAWVIAVVSVPKLHTVKLLFLSYVVAWIFAIIITVVFSILIWRKLGINKKAKLEKKENINEKAY